MEKLIQRYNDQINRTDTYFVRYLQNDVNWNAKLNAILGARGVGKTTLIF